MNEAKECGLGQEKRVWAGVSLVLVQHREALDEGKVGRDGLKLWVADGATLVCVIHLEHSLHG